MNRVIRKNINGEIKTFIQMPLTTYRSIHKELSFLRKFNNGKLQEYRIAELTGGQVSKKYNSPYDVITPKGLRIKVKISTINWERQQWAFSNTLKSYDWLILIGEKENIYTPQYINDEDYIHWLIPRHSVGAFSDKNGSIFISINPKNKTNKRIHHLMTTEETISEIDNSN